MSLVIYSLSANPRPQVPVVSSKTLQAELGRAKVLLSAHMAKRPHWHDIAVRADWANEKDRIRTQIGLIEGQLRNRWQAVPSPAGPVPQEAPQAPAPRRKGGQPGPQKTPAQRTASALRKAGDLMEHCRVAPDGPAFIRLTDQLNSLRNEFRRYCASQGMEMPEFPANLPNPFAKKKVDA